MEILHPNRFYIQQLLDRQREIERDSCLTFLNFLCETAIDTVTKHFGVCQGFTHSLECFVIAAKCKQDAQVLHLQAPNCTVTVSVVEWIHLRLPSCGLRFGILYFHPLLGIFSEKLLIKLMHFKMGCVLKIPAPEKTN